MFGKRIGVGLGTANVLVYVRGRGIVIKEPSVVAVAQRDNSIVAVGGEALEMLGRTPAALSGGGAPPGSPPPPPVRPTGCPTPWPPPSPRACRWAHRGGTL